MNILILEPNKIYSCLIKANLEKYLFFTNCDVIDSFKELKERDKIKEYDLYITSDVLIDSEKRHLEYLKNKKFILITNSENIDKNAIDYIRKSDTSIINYLVKLVKRFQNNKYLKVLLVENDYSLRNYKKKLLEKINLNVIDTEYLREALRILDRESVNVVIINVDNKDLDTIEFVKEVRKKFNSHKLPIIIISDFDNMPKTVEAMKYGANTFIQKPFLEESFLIRINNILEIFNVEIDDKEIFIDSVTKVYNGFYLNILDNFSKIYPKKSVAILKLRDFEEIKKEKGLKEVNIELIKFVNQVKKLIRRNDIIVRLHKDTFLIFMPYTTKNEAQIAVNKIKKLIPNINTAVADEGETLAEISKLAYDRLK